MRISLDGRKPEGEWASLNESCGRGDGKTVSFQTPFPAREARALHIMRDTPTGYEILAPDNIRRVLDVNGDLLRDEPDGYALSKTSDDAPVTITFDRPPGVGVRIACSALGRRPENGEALKVLPMTDTISAQLDAKMPAEFRKRKREINVALPAVQDMYREAYNRLVVDCYGFRDDQGAEITWDEFRVKKAILETLTCVLLGPFAMDRARAIQRERSSGLAAELSD